ncbi:unnamed protein product [Parnassius mnemosyne]|uniref:Peptidase C1A papain C-terminal domain-containing protein n=1 Tax=Parnassius mnemosyne TaxID=213953 RepID=A0AAV1LFC5_9NEOP
MFYILLFLISITAAFDEEIHFKYETLPWHEFVEYFNNLNLTWKISVHNNNDDNHQHCSVIGLNQTYPKITHDLSVLDLPEIFDAREKWSQCTSIGKIYDQQTCGSCWMFATATTATDRNCIHANINVDLSEQDLGCCADCYIGPLCLNGGLPDRAFNFWISNGLVSYDCRPYNNDDLMNDNVCYKSCVNNKDYVQDKNYGGKMYTVAADAEQIKAELFTNGPVAASFVVYDDIRNYTSGVYAHKYGKRLGNHAVRIIGYGEESGEKYWLIANSWGMNRGENGFYKIKQFQEDIQLENHIIAAIPRGQ